MVTYLLILFGLNALATTYYIGKGGMYMTRGNLFFSLAWSLVNIFLVLVLLV